MNENERGASSTEYGLLIFAIAAVIALVVFSLGQVNRATYQASCNHIASQVKPGTTC